MTDFYSQNRCVCSTRSHGPLLCAFCLSFHFKLQIRREIHIYERAPVVNAESICGATWRLELSNTKCTSGAIWWMRRGCPLIRACPLIRMNTEIC